MLHLIAHLLSNVRCFSFKIILYFCFVFSNLDGQLDFTLYNNFSNFESSIGNDNFVNAITGSPIDDVDVDIEIDDIAVLNSPIDFGEFHETTADVSSNSLLNAICGNLSMK